MSSAPASSPRSLLALDFGHRRIGVATGSCITGTASALETIAAVAGEPGWARLTQIINEWSPDLIVLGLPLNTDGTESEMTAAAKVFAAEIRSRYQLAVELVDERYTSAEAEALLKDQRRSGIRNKKLKKEDVDALAAQLIAESWLNAAGRS
jgi:putative Holliday junction resolvase